MHSPIFRSMKPFIYLLFLFCAYSAKAQKNWLPDVHLRKPSSTDTSQWKLVLNEEFKGPGLNKAKWLTINHWFGKEDEDWGGSRYDGGRSIIRDENVIVENGFARLIVMHKKDSWQCQTCNEPVRTANYTTGYLNTRYSIFFNTGKIETRLKMPFYYGAWTTIWTWGNRVNEIDMAEASYATGRLPYNTYNLHAFAPRENPLKLPVEYGIGNRFPQQDWFSWLSGDRHRFDEWHTYIAEWDTAYIRILLDGRVVKYFGKYYQPATINLKLFGKETTLPVKRPMTGDESDKRFKITEGYPYHPNSESRLILSTGMQFPDNLPDNDSVFKVDEMLIDYVKVSQRGGILSNHKPLCLESNDGKIINTFVSKNGKQYRFKFSQPTSKGKWSAGKNVNFLEANPDSCLIALTSATNGYFSIKYQYGENADCLIEEHFENEANLLQSNHKISIIEAQNAGAANLQFLLAVHDQSPERGVKNPHQYEWAVSYYPDSNRKDNSYHQTIRGKYSSTAFWPSPSRRGLLRWTLRLSTKSGNTLIRKGSYAANNFRLMPSSDSNVWHFRSRITDKKWLTERITNDWLACNIDQNMDSVDLSSMLEQIKFEQMYRFVVFNRQSTLGHDLSKKYDPNFSVKAGRKTIIKTGNRFKEPHSVHISFLDLENETRFERSFNKPQDEYTLRLNDLKQGFYILQIRQGLYTELMLFFRS